MSEKWWKAAEKYKQNKVEELNEVTQDLQNFVKSRDGLAAMALLKASGRHLIFGEENPGGGYGVVYYIDGYGLRKSIEAMGVWVAYSKNVPKPNISTITPEEAVRAAVHQGGKEPNEIMTWLRKELDKIAESIL